MKPSTLLISGMCEGLRELSLRTYQLHLQMSGGDESGEVTPKALYDKYRVSLSNGDDFTQNSFQHFMLSYNMPLVEMMYSGSSEDPMYWSDILVEEFEKTLH